MFDVALEREVEETLHRGRWGGVMRLGLRRVERPRLQSAAAAVALGNKVPRFVCRCACCQAIERESGAWIRRQLTRTSPSPLPPPLPPSCLPFRPSLQPPPGPTPPSFPLPSPTFSSCPPSCLPYPPPYPCVHSPLSVTTATSMCCWVVLPAPSPPFPSCPPLITPAPLLYFSLPPCQLPLQHQCAAGWRHPYPQVG